MKQVLMRKGQIRVDDVPAPLVEAGSVLVDVRFSCISAGTELSGIRAGAKPLWKRAVEQPEKVKKLCKMALSDGLLQTKSRVDKAVLSEKPIGYSLAGTVRMAGADVQRFSVGDRVACAGAQYAHHAEVVRVPSNLTVRLPDGLDFAEASTVTLGAIALQGVRRLNPTLGETFVVIGLGILGQLTAQLLKANGCRVIGFDLNAERVALACSLGMDMALDARGDHIENIHRLTSGVGADGVTITAATPSSEVLSTAFKMCRRKGRVVLVGDVGIDINRADIYQKELDFFISTSYGPGRYDATYEEHGLDYPVGYVRWTENRNMAEYLRLLADGRLNVKALVSETYSVDDAPRAYHDLQHSHAKRMISLLAYPETKEAAAPRIDVAIRSEAGTNGKTRIAVIGAGAFARGMHLPNLNKLSGHFAIRAICDRSGHNAKSTAKRFQADYATTDYEAVLEDPDVDAVLIATRHHLHAPMTIAALNTGKHVFVEKPLAMNQAELDAIQAFYSGKRDGPILQTGFNRRFSPHMRFIKDIVGKRSNPMIINYLMNAGYLPPDHWQHGPEGGGRNIGEACHIYDLFTYLTEAETKHVSVRHIRPATEYYSAGDNFICTIGYDDGSLATLTYTALGSKDYPKEKMEILVDGQVIVMDDYRYVEAIGVGAGVSKTKTMNKGLEEELCHFAMAIKGEIPWPIPFWQQTQAMRVSFAVEMAYASQ